MKLNCHRSLSEAEHIPQMTGQFHIAIPGEIGPITASNWYTVEANIGYRHRLNKEWFAIDVFLGDTEKCAFKRKHPVSIVAGALGEED